MKAIRYDLITENKARVTTIFHQPELEVAETLMGSLLVDDVPAMDYPFGKESTMYVNPQTSEIWVEYTDRPLSYQEQTILAIQENALLKQENTALKININDLNQAMAFLMGGGL